MSVKFVARANGELKTKFDFEELKSFRRIMFYC